MIPKTREELPRKGGTAVGPVMNSATATSSNEAIKAKIAPEMMPGAMSGTTTVRAATQLLGSEARGRPGTGTSRSPARSR